jgi:hypothetical protein
MLQVAVRDIGQLAEFQTTAGAAAVVLIRPCLGLHLPTADPPRAPGQQAAARAVPAAESVDRELAVGGTRGRSRRRSGGLGSRFRTEHDGNQELARKRSVDIKGRGLAAADSRQAACA